jgi:hypothetical protein
LLAAVVLFSLVLEEVRMAGHVGDRISLESEKVGKPAREGEILEVLESVVGVHYRVRWNDGHESDIRPAAGSARIIPAPAKKKAKGA